MKKSISTFWEQESDYFIPRKGREWEFPLTPAVSQWRFDFSIFSALQSCRRLMTKIETRTKTLGAIKWYSNRRVTWTAFAFLAMFFKHIHMCESRVSKNRPRKWIDLCKKIESCNIPLNHAVCVTDVNSWQLLQEIGNWRSWQVGDRVQDLCLVVTIKKTFFDNNQSR